MTPSQYKPQDIDLIVNTPEVRVAEITLAPHADTPPHKHTQVPEVCYCLEGELSCHVEGHAPSVLRAGQKKTFAAGSHHQLRNTSDAPCRFLLIHGIGTNALDPNRRQ